MCAALTSLNTRVHRGKETIRFDNPEVLTRSLSRRKHSYSRTNPSDFPTADQISEAQTNTFSVGVLPILYIWEKGSSIGDIEKSM